MTSVPPSLPPTLDGRPSRRPRKLVIGLIAAFVFTCLIPCLLLSFALASCRLPKDDELITMFHEKRLDLEQLRAMYEYDTTPKFTASDFLSFKFLPGEFSGQFTIRGLLEAIAAHGIEIPQARPGKPQLTDIQALNKLLAKKSIYDNFPHLALPAEAMALLQKLHRQQALLSEQQIQLNRQILQTAFPDKCPKKLIPEEESRKLLKAISAQGISMPPAPTAMESLNKLLSGDSLHDRFSNIPLPKEAEGLLSQGSGLSEIERIKLNRLILGAAFPNECPKPGAKLWAVYDTSDFGRFCGLLAYRPEQLDLVGVSNKRIKEYQRLLRRSGFRGIDGAPRATRITVYVEGLSIGGAVHKGYSYPYESPDTKFIVRGLDYEKPPQKPDTFYRHIEAGWYLYRIND